MKPVRPLLTALAPMLALGSSAVAATRQPNILMVFCDDLTIQAISAYKLFHFYEPDMDYWTLIDRERDPHELKNVYDDPSYAGTRRELHAELQRLRTDLKVPAQDSPESMRGKQAPAPATKKGKADKG